MTRRAAGAALLDIQMALVLSVAAKFFYERTVRPRVWARAAGSDPILPLRGRYLALPLLVDACGLPRDKAYFKEGFKVVNQEKIPGYWEWTVSLAVRNGALTPLLNDRPRDPSDADSVVLHENVPCDRATLSHGGGGFTEVDYFIPDTARSPLPLKPGQELWVEVTVPAEGPPRSIQLALSDANGFRTLRF